MRIAIAALAATLLPLAAQDFKLPPAIEQLKTKADETVEVTLDKSMLHFAGRFLSDKDDEAKAKGFMNGLDSVYVRSFEFSREGEYDKADLEAVRVQFQAPTWFRIVGVRSNRSGEDVDVYFKNGANGQLSGVVVIAAEPRELTIVHITGTFDPGRLADIGGQFHIPRLHMMAGSFGGRDRK